MTTENVRLVRNSTGNANLCVMLITSSDGHNVYRQVHHIILNLIYSGGLHCVAVSLSQVVVYTEVMR